MNPEQIKALEDYAEWRERAFDEGADASVAAFVEHCENDRAYDTLAEVHRKANKTLKTGLPTTAEAAERALGTLAEIADLTAAYGYAKAVAKW